MKIRYKVYNPAGNITALVIGDEYNEEQKKRINSAIMEKNLKVEQVGFISTKDIKLTMAGGEFCGNAIRCAAHYYINKYETKAIKIKGKKVRVGVDENKDIWCEIPIKGYQITKISENYIVKLKGITIVIVDSKRYIKKDLKKEAKNIIKLYRIDDNAVGVMFKKIKNNELKIYPVVWVKRIDTLFFENACGSGSIAVTMIESLISNESKEYVVYQPSGHIIKTIINVKNGKVHNAILKGEVLTYNKTYEIEI